MNFKNYICHPGLFFESLSQKEKQPTWVSMLIIMGIALLSSLSVYFTMSNASASIDTSDTGSVATFISVFSMVTILVNAVLGWIIQSLIYWLLLKKIGKKDKTFKYQNILYATGIASIPLAIPAILNLISTFIIPASTANAGFNWVTLLATNCNIFAIWSYILTIFALSRFSSVKTNKVTIIVICMLLLIVVPTVVSGLFTPAIPAV